MIKDVADPNRWSRIYVGRVTTELTDNDYSSGEVEFAMRGNPDIEVILSSSSLLVRRVKRTGSLVIYVSNRLLMPAT